MSAVILLSLISAFAHAGPAVEDWMPKDIAWRSFKNKNQDPVLVAVIDTGVDTNHPDLKNVLWRNPGEIGTDASGRDKATNKIDDDHNGYIDDVHGWDFVRGQPASVDSHGHGTHIAGIIQKLTTNVQIMVLNYYSETASAAQTIDYTAKSIEYAVRMKAQIINYSGGGPTSSDYERSALQLAQKNNVLVVAAAGNDGHNSDRSPYYPAAYDFNHILSVAAHDPTRKLLKSSNFGTHSVDVSAPGWNILSLKPGGGRTTMTGTSQATAVTTAVAAMAYRNQKDLRSPQKLIEHLILTSVDNPFLKGKLSSGKSISASRTVFMHHTLPIEQFANDEAATKFEIPLYSMPNRSTATYLDSPSE